MTEQKKVKKACVRVALYLLGMLILSVSLTLNTKVTLGVSSIISVAYCVSALSGASIGDTTLLWFILLAVVFTRPLITRMGNEIAGEVGEQLRIGIDPAAVDKQRSRDLFLPQQFDDARVCAGAPCTSAGVEREKDDFFASDGNARFHARD